MVAVIIADAALMRNYGTTREDEQGVTRITVRKYTEKLYQSPDLQKVKNFPQPAFFG